MDRLPAPRGALAPATVALVFAALAAGCDRKEAAPPPARVDAVEVKPRQKQERSAKLCDARPGRAFTWPALAGDAPPAASGWRWINVWATWCRPCVEEIPLLRELERHLEEGGARVELVFLSADESEEAVNAFRAEHPELPPGPRVADPEALPAWISSVGLDEGAPIPIHVFVDPAGKVRCARSGSLSRPDLSAVTDLIGR